MDQSSFPSTSAAPERFFRFFSSPYPALVTQSQFGKHPTAAYVIPNSQLCYQFAFQRITKNDTKYRCIACRPVKNVFVTVKNNFFTCNPAALPHACSPKLLTREIIFRLANQKLKDIEKDTGSAPSKAKLYIGDLIPGAATGAIESNIQEQTDNAINLEDGDNDYFNSREDDIKTETVILDDESQDMDIATNNDQILDYIMYNCANEGTEQSTQSDSPPILESMDVSVKIEESHPSVRPELYPEQVQTYMGGPSTSEIKSELMEAYGSENGDVTDPGAILEIISTSKPLGEEVYPAMVTQSKFGKHPSVVYLIPNTNMCYIFNFQRNNKDDKKYRCLGCRPYKNLFVTVKDNFFIQDPCTLDHACRPKDVLKTITSYKALDETEQDQTASQYMSYTNKSVISSQEPKRQETTAVRVDTQSEESTVKQEAPSSPEYEYVEPEPVTVARGPGIQLEPSVTLFPAIQPPEDYLDTRYPALVNQSKFGKHSSVTYVIPNTHLCYTFAFQRKNKNDSKYGCLACKRMFVNLFVNVKDNFFISDPSRGHCCKPKELPMEMATRLSYKKLQEIGVNPNAPAKQPKRHFEDLILETEANGEMDPTLREETLRCLEGDYYSKRRKAISRRVNMKVKESASDIGNRSNATQYLDYIMNNFGNSEEGRIMESPTDAMEQDSNHSSGPEPQEMKTEIIRAHPGPVYKGLDAEIKLEPSTSYQEPSLATTPDTPEAASSNPPPTPGSSMKTCKTPYPALVYQSKFGKHNSVTYVIPNTHLCYTFGFQRQNKNDGKYGCLACKRMEKNVFINVKDAYFLQDPRSLPHCCNPKELPKEMATRLSYKKLQEIEETRYESPKQPKKHFEDLIMEAETNGDLDPSVREETAKLLLGAGYLKKRTAISRRVNKKVGEPSTLATIPAENAESPSKEDNFMNYIVQTFVNAENGSLPDTPIKEEEPEEDSYDTPTPVAFQPDGPSSDESDDHVYRPELKPTSSSENLDVPFTSSYPALVTQSMFGKHPTAAYIIPNTHLCYTFAFQRNNKIGIKYRCLACRPEKNVFAYVKDGYFLSDPTDLPHCCAPKELPKEMATRLSYKKLREIEQDSESLPKKPKRHFEDLIMDAETNGELDPSVREETAKLIQGSGFTSKRRSISRRVHKRFKESSSMETDSEDLELTSNGEDQVVNYIMNNFVNPDVKE